MKRPRHMELKLLAPVELAGLLNKGGFCLNYMETRLCPAGNASVEGKPMTKAELKERCLRCILSWLNEEVDKL